MTNSKQFSKTSTYFFVQVHTFSYWLDVGWISFTYFLILESKLKKSLITTCLSDGRGRRARRHLESCNSTKSFCLKVIYSKYLIGQSKLDVQVESQWLWGNILFTKKKREWIIINNNIIYHSIILFLLLWYTVTIFQQLE